MNSASEALNYASLKEVKNSTQHVDLNVLIDHIRTDLELLIAEKHATIRADNLPVVNGNQDLLYQLFYNLINNSLKFSRPGVPSLIEIIPASIEMEGKHFFEITLRDNGIGFDNEFSDLIFNTFFRLNSKDKYEGSGLGLALCKKIVESHGGQISASGKKDKGAQFTILLPKL